MSVERKTAEEIAVEVIGDIMDHWDGSEEIPPKYNRYLEMLSHPSPEVVEGIRRPMNTLASSRSDAEYEKSWLATHDAKLRGKCWRERQNWLIIASVPRISAVQA